VGEFVEPTCGGQAFAATKVAPNMHILLDTSGSMKDPLDPQGDRRSLWTIASATVKSTTQALDTQLRFGLQNFSVPGGHCSVGKVLVTVAERTSAAIAAALPANAEGNGTPLGAALRAASGLSELEDKTRANYVLLITDGEETCGGNSKREAELLLAKGIKTYVVGFGGDVKGSKTLSDIATAGGTARPTGTAFYQADDAAALDAALKTISRGAVGCDFGLNSAPPDANALYVFMNGKTVVRDATHKDGWDYNAASQRVTVYGNACDALTADENAKFEVVYGCAVPPIN